MRRVLLARSCAMESARVQPERERERRLLLSWAKAGNDSKGRNKATRSEGDDLGDSAARALMRHGGRGRVKGVEEVGVGSVCRGARSRGDRRSEIEVDPKRRGLRHDMSDLALETVEESRAFGENLVLIGLR